MTIIEPKSSLRLVDFSEAWQYRDLFGFLIWRQVRVRYAQSALGFGWAIIQPVFSMLIFTIIFGKLAKMETDGSPYALFSMTGLLAWTYFSNALTDGVSSLVSEANMIRKIYFPRLFLPMSSVCAKLVDFIIACGVMVVLMCIYKQAPSSQLLLFPIICLVMIMFAAGCSLWLTALAVQFRDVKHAIPFLVQIGMYASPVVYSTSIIPDKYRIWFSLNPMVGVIEGFRSILLDSQPLPLSELGVGSLVSLLILLSGLAFFNYRESLFADIA